MSLYYRINCSSMYVASKRLTVYDTCMCESVRALDKLRPVLSMSLTASDYYEPDFRNSLS